MVSDNPETFADLDGHISQQLAFCSVDICAANSLDIVGDGPQPTNSGDGQPPSNSAQVAGATAGQQQSDQHNQSQQQQGSVWYQCTNATCTTSTQTMVVTATAENDKPTMGAAGVIALTAPNVELGPGDLLLVLGALTVYETAVHWHAISGAIFSKGSGEKARIRAVAREYGISAEELSNAVHASKRMRGMGGADNLTQEELEQLAAEVKSGAWKGSP